MNRIDEYIVFEGLKREQIKMIVRIQAKRVADRLAAKKISLDLQDSAVDYLVVILLPLSPPPLSARLCWPNLST